MFPNLSIVLQFITGDLPHYYGRAAEACRTLLFENGTNPDRHPVSSVKEERFEALLLLLQVHREDTPSVDVVLYHFAATSARRLHSLTVLAALCRLHNCQARLVPVRTEIDV